MVPQPCSLVFAKPAHQQLLCAVLPRPCIVVGSVTELAAECEAGGSVAFVSAELLDQVDRMYDALSDVPIVAILDTTAADALPRTIRTLSAYPWLCHVMAASLLSAPRGGAHVELLLQRLASSPDHSMLGPFIGRMAHLNSARRRGARMARVRQFYAKHGVPERTITSLDEVADELVLNALYDAPADAGYFDRPRQRGEDVELPLERSCQISYGIEDGMAFVRVRDTFGALTRSRLLNVLVRCSAKDVALDESRGGAGLGLWRVFSAAHSVTVTVVPGQLTEMLVGIGARSGTAARQQLAVHLFFAAETDRVLAAIPEDDRGIDDSITLIHVA